MSEHVDTIVVGGGQAGLSTSWHLKKAGREHIILDRGRIGDTWRQPMGFVLPRHTKLDLRVAGFSLWTVTTQTALCCETKLSITLCGSRRALTRPLVAKSKFIGVGPSGNGARFSLETAAGTYSADNVIIATWHPSKNLVSRHGAKNLRATSFRYIPVTT